ncbi:hypothetical protein Bbelb_434680 [Branchiostoma belcheri]|nr:hypothetical protein Bbelb_434680 [Branchiostoma belcheri]
MVDGCCVFTLTGDVSAPLPTSSRHVLYRPVTPDDRSSRPARPATLKLEVMELQGPTCGGNVRDRKGRQVEKKQVTGRRGRVLARRRLVEKQHVRREGDEAAPGTYLRNLSAAEFPNDPIFYKRTSQEDRFITQVRQIERAGREEEGETCSTKLPTISDPACSHSFPPESRTISGQTSPERTGDIPITGACLQFPTLSVTLWFQMSPDVKFFSDRFNDRDREHKVIKKDNRSGCLCGELRKPTPDEELQWWLTE